MISPENLSLIVQLISSEEDALREMEKLRDKKDIEKFNKVKEELIKFQKQISDMLNNGD